VFNSAQPHRRQPTRLPRPWDSPGKNTGVGCHFLLQCIKVKSESEVAQSCLTLRDPMDCSPSDSSIHGIFQARVLEWGAIAFSKQWPWYNLNNKSKAVIYSNHEHIVVSWWNVVTNHHGPNTELQCLSVASLLSPVSLYTTDFLLSIFFKWWKYRKWGRINVKLILVWFLEVREEAERGRVRLLRNSNYYHPYVYIFKNSLTTDWQF